MDYKKMDAPRSTETQDRNLLDKATDNIYESLVIIAKRADQIGADIKVELHDKLDEFATHSENLEEIFENKEQIEVSRFYEALPKPHAMALEQWKNGQIYYRKPEETTPAE